MSAPAAASDAPLREPGTRARSGNAMLRTRANLLEAAAHCVERYGVRRTTMGDIALKAVVAKATLYNHFRTKDDVLVALVEAQVAALAERRAAVAAEKGIAAALDHAAGSIGANAALRRVAEDEPDLLLPLLAPDDARGWHEAQSAVAAVLEAAGCSPDHGEAVLRWLVSQLLWPAAPGAGATVAALGASAAPGQGRDPSSAGLGWPGDLTDFAAGRSSR